MDLEFTGEIWFWKGPSPWHFITVPDDECGALEAVASRVSYGWGMIPVTAQIGQTRWKTSLFPKDGAYVVPVRVAAQRAERLELGDVVSVRLTVEV
ncbi:DUF1905 domain-containing protein [Nostocoides sp. HKS02]|uniref:DUF1905 domain-containing protein n=1 Tax=Nostocoides sp. HKS02 TaxID=1813880 RepID=UPI0012B4DBAB|nr:DUF1905 domain-containing protein [Tetrasphaera sp. HKS02]QGN59034.1 DUF1905 domain-containing protein [Tetrasphaera sp. HKS02]